jgi:hypothetical protein
MSLHPIAAAIGLALVVAAPAQAFNPQPDPPARFAMVGLVVDQTARLNVVAMPTRRDVPSGPCRLTLSFKDSQGNPLIASTSLVLPPGKAMYADLYGARLPGAEGRIQFLPAVQVSPNVPGEGTCPGVAASIEVFDGTGHTSVYIEDPNLYLPH